MCSPSVCWGEGQGDDSALRALDVLLEDLGSSLSTHIMAQNCLDFLVPTSAKDQGLCVAPQSLPDGFSDVILCALSECSFLPGHHLHSFSKSANPDSPSRLSFLGTLHPATWPCKGRTWGHPRVLLLPMWACFVTRKHVPVGPANWKFRLFPNSLSTASLTQ